MKAHTSIRKNGPESITTERRNVANQAELIATVKALEAEGWINTGFGRLIHSDGRPHELEICIPGLSADFRVLYEATNNRNGDN